MVPFNYWVLRLCRRVTPQRIVDFILDRGICLKPGKETSTPQTVAGLYAEWAGKYGHRLEGSTVCVAGFGGGFGVGVYLLERGARRVILQDPYAPVRSRRNRHIPVELIGRYFRKKDGDWVPNGVQLVHVRQDLPSYSFENPESADIVFSRSVLEHVVDAEAVVAACARLTRMGGLNIHLINLQDHVFAYPFEMLCYSKRTWDKWLNPGSNLNRLRTQDYAAIFRRHFSSMDVTIVESLKEEFHRVRSRIRPEFLTGDDEIDSAAIIRIDARK